VLNLKTFKLFFMKPLLYLFFGFTLIISSCDKASSSSDKVTSIDCGSVDATGTLQQGEASSGVSFELFYEGGNGKTYSSQSIKSTGVLGLTAKLVSGTLENGEGSVIYIVTGTPSSGGSANFSVTLGGKSCTVALSVEGEGTPLPPSFEKVTSIDCSSLEQNGTLKKGEASSGVSFRLFYNGGNGKTYSSQSVKSTGVLGLTATLSTGTLENGDGSVVYLVTGTPTTSGSANFPIVLGGQSCTVSINVADESQSSGINFTSNGSPVGVFQNNVSDVDGNTYKTVKIGTQIWMAENLKTSKYNDGTTIPNITDDTQWLKSTAGAWAYYNNDAANNAKYGKLYNWYAVSKTTNGNKNVCPTGWHVPTDAEWTVLMDYLGGENVAGGKLKEVGTTNWKSPNKGATNVSLFTGLPGGSRSSASGYYDFIGYYGNWWSSTEYNTGLAWYRLLHYGIGDADRNYFFKEDGFSVRCLRD
jgi:uncharacterized protein (TIGR02145 family)